MQLVAEYGQDHPKNSRHQVTRLLLGDKNSVTMYTKSQNLNGHVATMAEDILLAQAYSGEHGKINSFGREERGPGWHRLVIIKANHKCI